MKNFRQAFYLTGVLGTLLFLLALAASGQTNPGAVPNHAVPIGKGPGVAGFSSAAPGAASTVLQSNGAAADPSFATVTLILDSFCTARGSLLFRNATVWTCLSPGTADQPLTTQGAGADPTYKTLPVTTGGTGLTTLAQGSILFGNASTPLTELAKDTNATRYLANTGTSNNPTWDRINLLNGVTGTLPVTNGGSGIASATAYAVLTGGTTSTNPFQSIASVGTSGQILTSNGAGFLPSFQARPSASTLQVFTSGSGTYTTAAGATVIEIVVVGGGGGGGGSGTGGGISGGGVGGNSTFNAGAIAGNGGGAGAGAAGGNSLGGTGGTASGGTINLTGGWGGSTFTALAGVTFPGGQGGSSVFGGAGGGSNTGNPGQVGATNSGGGGGGAGAPASGGAGSGGGSGGYSLARIASPAASYTYAVGAAGTAGAAGTSGSAGGIGGSGIVIVTEYY